MQPNGLRFTCIERSRPHYALIYITCERLGEGTQTGGEQSRRRFGRQVEAQVVFYKIIVAINDLWIVSCDDHEE